jgi:hypothetical protein
LISGWLSDIFFILYYYTIKKKYAIMCFLFNLIKVYKMYFSQVIISRICSTCTTCTCIAISISIRIRN